MPDGNVVSPNIFTVSGSVVGQFHRCQHTLTQWLHHRTHRQTETIIEPQVDTPKTSSSIARTMSEWGMLHEEFYVREAGYQSLPDFRLVGKRAAQEATTEAMQENRPRLHRAYLRRGTFEGEVDLLRWVPSTNTGGWYEVGDVKSSTRPKPEQVMQVLFYSALLEAAQGTRPTHGFIVLASGQEWRFALSDYWPYFLAVMHEAQQTWSGQRVTAPAWQKTCLGCRWQADCYQVLAQQDDLTLLHGLRPTELARLHQHEVFTTAALAELTQTVAGIGLYRLRVLQQQVLAQREGLIRPLLPFRSSLAPPLLPTPLPAVAFITLCSDFTQGDKVVALVAQVMTATSAEPVQVWTHTAEGRMNLATWLAEALPTGALWFTWDNATATLLRRITQDWPKRPAMQMLREAVQETWAFPEGNTDLRRVAGHLGHASFTSRPLAEHLLTIIQLYRLTPQHQGAVMQDLIRTLSDDLAGLQHVLSELMAACAPSAEGQL